MKVQGEIDIDVSGGTQVGMLAQWDGKVWKATTKRSALSDVCASLEEKEAEIASLREAVETLTSHINTLAKAIGGKKDD